MDESGPTADAIVAVQGASALSAAASNAPPLSSAIQCPRAVLIDFGLSVQEREFESHGVGDFGPGFNESPLLTPASNGTSAGSNALLTQRMDTDNHDNSPLPASPTSAVRTHSPTNELSDEAYAELLAAATAQQVAKSGSLDSHIDSMSNSMNMSKSRHMLDLSAVGCRAYVAPEVLKGAKKNHSVKRSFDSADGRSTPTGGSFDTGGGGSFDTGGGRSFDSAGQRMIIAPLKSNYGLVADAYSFGVLLRECLTGVPPTHSLQDYISKNSSLFACCMSAGASVGPKRQFKSINELPEGESGL